MQARETGKRRAQRIPLDYYKKSDGLVVGKWVLSALALVLAAGWWASGWDLSGGSIKDGPRALLRVSKGPVASVHQAWDAKCEACHKPFTSVDGKKWLPPAFVSAGSDQLCQACHQGPAHHASQLSEDVKSCAGCHADHRGRDASLVWIADSDCTSCHASLDAHRDKSKEGPRTYAATIKSFATDHPAFPTEAKTAVDTGNLKFNHALHMTPGQVKAAGDRGPMTWSRLSKADQARYGRGEQSEETPVLLDCRSCHVADAGDSIAAKGPAGPDGASPDLPRGDGAIMLPIRYENHCQACHPLTFDSDPKLIKLSAPHGVQPEEIKRFLSDTYAGQYVRSNPDALNTPRPPRPFPGRPLGSNKDQETVRQAIAESVAKAEATLLAGKQSCQECHWQAGAVGKPLASGEMLKTVEVPNVPNVWMPHAQFNHSSHRAMDCLQCHGGAKTSTTATSILMPTIESCRECHAPATRNASGETVAGVVHDCTACHRYHNGDNPLQGRGALAEAGGDLVSLTRFLTGSSGGKSSVPMPRPAAAK